MEISARNNTNVRLVAHVRSKRERDIAGEKRCYKPNRDDDDADKPEVEIPSNVLVGSRCVPHNHW